VNILAALALAVFVESGQVNTGHSVLRDVGFEPDADLSIVTIEATGPLPYPRVGVLDDPPRIYLDFAGVVAGTHGNDGGPDAPVRRVRVAVNQPDPLVTRVVIDLSRPSPHRVDARQRAAGRIRVVLDSRAPGDGFVANAAAPKPSVRRSAQTAVERANAAMLVAAAQLERLRPLLVSVDARIDVPEESLHAAVSEFAAIRQILTALRASEAQDALIKVCVLGATAAGARIDAQQHADVARAWNAASAAAGALMMLDRASKPARHE
jgi:hypothetical protein